MLAHNLFAYCKSNPVNSKDPTGKSPVDTLNRAYDAVKVILAVGVAYFAYIMGSKTNDLIDSFIDEYQSGNVALSDSNVNVDDTPVVDKRTGKEVVRFVVDDKGNVMIEPVGGKTIPAGRGGVDTHTTYPNGSNYNRLNPKGHPKNQTPHGHGHLPGSGPGIKGQ
jgi:hypothetical protein